MFSSSMAATPVNATVIGIYKLDWALAHSQINTKHKGL
jgi:hypothetical protein